MSEYKFENCVVTVYDFKNMVIPAGATINIYGSGFKVSATGNDQKDQKDQKQVDDVSSNVDPDPTTSNNAQSDNQEYKVDDLKAVINSQDAKKEFLAAIINDVDDGKIAGAFCFDLDDYAEFDNWLTAKSKSPLSDRSKYSVRQFASDFNVSAV